jgi:hypothetical protein
MKNREKEYERWLTPPPRPGSIRSMRRRLLIPILVVVGSGGSLAGHGTDHDLRALDQSTLEAPAFEQDVVIGSRAVHDDGSNEQRSVSQTRNDDGSPNQAVSPGRRFLAVPAPTRSISLGPQTTGSGHGFERARPNDRSSLDSAGREPRAQLNAGGDLPPPPTPIPGADRYPRPPPVIPHQS